MPGKVSRKKYIASLFPATVVFAVLLITGAALNTSPDNLGTSISDRFNTDFTPVDITFGVWHVMFAWQIGWLAYAWVLAFRTSCPVMISPESLLYYTLLNLFILYWLILWLNGLPQFGFPVLIIAGILLYLMIALQGIFVYRNTAEWKTILKTKYDLPLIRFLVFNGMVFYGTMGTISVLLNFSIVLEYFIGASKLFTGTFSLFLLLLVVLGYFNLENVVLDPILRDVVCVYPIVAWLLYGIIKAISNSYDGLNATGKFATFLLLFVIFLFVVRVLLIAFLSLKKPIQYPTATIDPERAEGNSTNNAGNSTNNQVAPTNTNAVAPVLRQPAGIRKSRKPKPARRGGNNKVYPARQTTVPPEIARGRRLPKLPKLDATTTQVPDTSRDQLQRNSPSASVIPKLDATTTRVPDTRRDQLQRDSPSALVVPNTSSTLLPVPQEVDVTFEET